MVVLLEAPRDRVAEEFTVNLFKDTDAFLRSNHVDGLLPAHFTAATLPKLGARLLVHTRGSQIAAYGFALPSVNPESGLPDEKSYIVRGYRIDPRDTLALPEGWYDVGQSMAEDFSGEMIARVKTADGEILAMYHPDRSLAKQAKELQGEVWTSAPPDCYEFDLYNPNNGSATSLVVLDEQSGKVVGALLGFYGRNWKWMGDVNGEKRYGMWLESQIAAVAEKYRGNGISAALKWRQYKEAKARGISMIHWTVDPLQMVNAGLNLNNLGAVAAEHTRGLYSFTNALNKVPASRFGMYWMVDSDRSKRASERTLKIPSFREATSNMEKTQLIIPVYYDDGRPVNYFDYERWEPSGRETVLVQIPRNWSNMQDKKIEEAKMWREVTDGIFQKILGIGRGKYVIAGITYDENEKIGEKDRGTPYLIARRFDAISPELTPVKN